MVDWGVVAVIVGTAMTVVGWLVSRLTTQNEVIRTQRETIEVQRRQIDRYEAIDVVTEKVLSSLPQPRSPGGGKR